MLKDARIAICLLASLVVGCSGRPATYSLAARSSAKADNRWIRFRPSVGEASVSLPTAPEEMPQPPVATPTHLYTCPRSAGGSFQFGVSTCKDEIIGEETRTFLERIKVGSVSRPHTKLLSEQFRIVAGLDAIEYTISTHQDNTQIRYLVLLRGRHYYVLSSIGSAEQIADQDSENFFNSVRFDN